MDDDSDSDSDESVVEESVSEELEEESDLDDWFFEDLFHKNTESFQCLTQVEISRSSLLRDPYYHFPEIEDQNLYQALWVDEPPQVYDDIGVTRYLDLCKEAGIRPFRRVTHSLATDTLDLKFYALTEPQMKTICKTLEHNKYVVNFILQENFFSPESVKHLAPLILNNSIIEKVDLKFCQIGEVGAEEIGECFNCNKSITYLDLSYNKLGDEGVLNLIESLTDNDSIQYLNLSHNGLGDIAMKALGEMVSNNYSIKELDLSWNYLYTVPGIRDFFEGMKFNTSITTLNLAWNGIGDNDQLKAITQYLRTEETKLQHLNLCANRINDLSLRILRAGLKKNTSIRSLDLSLNPLKPAEIQFICGAFFDQELPLEYINFGEAWVNKSFIRTRNRIRRKGGKVDIGGIFSNYKIHGPDPKEVLLNRAKFVAINAKKKKFRTDIGPVIIMFNQDEVTKDEFLAMLKKNKIKLDQDLVQFIMKTFASGKRVNLLDIKETYLRMYPDTKPPPPKKKKGKKKKKKKAVLEEGAEGVAPPAEGAAPPPVEGEAPPAVEGEAPPAVEGEAPPAAEGEAPPPGEGEAAPLPEGEQPPEGEKPPEGEQPPEGEKPPEGENPPENESQPQSTIPESEAPSEAPSEITEG